MHFKVQEKNPTFFLFFFNILLRGYEIKYLEFFLICSFIITNDDKLEGQVVQYAVMTL